MSINPKRSVDLLETGTKLMLEQQRYIAATQSAKRLQELGEQAMQLDPIVWVFVFIGILFVTVLIVRYFSVQRERQELEKRMNEVNMINME